MFMFQILINVLLFSCAVLGEDEPNERSLKCGNCVAIANYRKDEVGFDCSSDDMAITFTRPGRRQGALKAAMLPECLPPKFEIIGDVYEYCCFWSPHLGCTQVYGKSYLGMFKNNCSVCAYRCGKERKEIVNSYRLRLIDYKSIFLNFLPLVVVVYHMI